MPQKLSANPEVLQSFSQKGDCWKELSQKWEAWAQWAGRLRGRINNYAVSAQPPFIHNGSLMQYRFRPRVKGWLSRGWLAGHIARSTEEHRPPNFINGPFVARHIAPPSAPQPLECW